MKLAEALMARADLQRKIAQIEKRMRQNAKVQDGDEPAEVIERLIPEYERTMDELEGLIAQINRTNNQTSLESSTLSEAITRRDCLKSKIHAYRDLYEAAAISQDRYSSKEIRFVRCVDPAKLQEKIDYLSKLYRQLDTKIQERNWTADMMA